MALARVDLDMNETVFGIVSQLLEQSNAGDKMEVDGDDSRKADEV